MKDISRKYDKRYDVLYVMLKDAYTYAEDDPDIKNVVVKRDETDDSVVGFIIFNYKKDKISVRKVIQKYVTAA